MWRRTPGFKPVYNNAQTRRYKSAHRRWQLGQSLQVDGIEPDGNEMLVRFRSQRSADGFWRVRVRGPAGLDVPNLPYYPSPPSVPPGTGPNVLWARVVRYYVITFGVLLCRDNAAPSWPQPPNSTYTHGGTESVTVTYSAPFPRSLFETPFNEPSAIGLLSAVYLTGSPPDVSYTIRTFGISYALDEFGYFPDDGSGGGGGGGGPVIGTDPANYELVSCDCPDYSKGILANPRSPWRSEQRSRTWATSRAGTAGMCKHMFATRKHFNIPTIEPRPDNPLDRARWQAARDSERALRLKRRRAWNERRRRELAEARAILKNARARDRAEMKAIRNQLKSVRQRRSSVAQANRLRREAAYAEAKRKFQARKADVLRALHPDSSASQEEIDLAVFRQGQYDRMEQEMRDREAGYNARVSKRRKKFRKR